MSDIPESSRSSDLTPLPETPSTPSPQDSRSNRVLDTPTAPNPDRTSRLSTLPSTGPSLESLQAMMRVESLLIGKGKAPDPSLSSLGHPSSPSASGPVTPEPASKARIDSKGDGHVRFSIKAEDSSHQGFDAPSDYDRPSSSPPSITPSSFPRSYSNDSAYSSSSTWKSSSKVKASDLPKFRREKGEDVEVWIEQLSAIFEANGSSNAEIVALLSVILKDTALKWFARLGVKGRSQFPTWLHWQEALRQRFLKANYLAEKKRLWKKRDLRDNEDMADYFDAKVDLQAYVFDEQTPDSELILDIMDGLPDYMLPNLKSAIAPTMDLLEFRRILLDYEKGLRWNGPWGNRRQDTRSNGKVIFNDRPSFRPSAQTGSNSKEALKPPRPCTCGVQVKDDSPPVVDAFLPEQDNEGYKDLYDTLCVNVSPVPNFQDRHSDKVPTEL
ncbi:hypothetical protein QFC20_007430 [Naganishia adeliensis]|uniref:Uncharacterized protein n=1 Tax=Naganishia adeliensis TaxID=92952 RepID=A0ACC2UZS2_9TREE|nr:hypothetical protein QFC20_007430 [Naganishia adeliensis]